MNDRIRAREVRLIGPTGDQLGIKAVPEALRMARGLDLDLVEVAPKARPPVCRIMDYGKFLYQKDKAAHAAKKKQKITQVKEIKFRPGTDIGDYQNKMRQMREFLEEGDKIKVTLRFRGREMAHQELGTQLMERIRTDVDELANVESFPRMEGRQAVMMLAPKKR